MDYRKLISFGKSSYIVSLPKKWVAKNGLKKGDTVSLRDDNTSITLFAQPNGQPQTEKRLVINVDNKSIADIQREIVPAYINNYSLITLIGDDLAEKGNAIQQVMHGLMALEIIERSTKRIVARDFLNMNDISVDDLMKKMNAITRSMIADLKQLFKRDLVESIVSRDEDVNRLCFLNMRAIKYAMQHSAVAQRYNLSASELLEMWMHAHTIEAVADQAKRVARIIRRTILTKGQQRHIIQILEHIENEFHKQKKKEYDIFKNIEQFHANINEKNAGILVERLKIMAAHISRLGH